MDLKWGVVEFRPNWGPSSGSASLAATGPTDGGHHTLDLPAGGPVGWGKDCLFMVDEPEVVRRAGLPSVSPTGGGKGETSRAWVPSVHPKVMVSKMESPDALDLGEMGCQKGLALCVGTEDTDLALGKVGHWPAWPGNGKNHWVLNPAARGKNWTWVGSIMEAGAA